jgi:HSP20 family protein
METVIAAAHRRDELGHLAHHMGLMMDKLVKSGFAPGARPPDWSPAVDVCELADRFEVIVEVAGVHRQEIEVYTEDRRLVITGCRHDPCPKEKVCLHHLEIEEGRFRRVLALPANADIEHVAARYRDGLLRIGIPKRQGT